MSHECCCLSNMLTGRNLFRGLTLTLLAGTTALALTVLSPWRTLDAAAPAAGDDPLSNRQLVRPVPSALEQRGLKKTGSDAALMLNNWTYTDDDPF